MPQDAFTLYNVTKELNEILTHGKINKITMPRADEIVANVYNNKAYRLIISADARLCRISLSDVEKENPLTPFNFCNLLRKHLLGSEIVSVSIVGFERIVKIVLLCKNDFFETVERILYAEIMGKYSNIFLTENGKILGALKTASLEINSKISIFCGSTYTLPPSQEKIEPSDKESIKDIFSICENANPRFISDNVKGIATVTAIDIAEKYNKLFPDFNSDNFSSFLYDYIYNEKNYPCIIKDGEKLIDFTARGKIAEYKTINDAQKVFYDTKEFNQIFDDKKRSLSTHVNAYRKKTEKKLSIILEKLQNCKDMETLRIKGELIINNIYLIKSGAESLKTLNYYDEKGGDIEILLDKNLSPSENAQKYYKKYNKQKKTVASVIPQKEETEKELKYAESLSCELDYCKTLADLAEIENELREVGIIAKNENNKKKKKKEEPSFRHYKYRDYDIYAGKNNIQNDMLLSLSSGNDLWLHAKKYHSCHVIIPHKAEEIPDDVILVAAEICAAHSGARDDKAEIDYCRKKYVKKPPKSKPGFVIYTDFKSCLAKANGHDELLIK